MSRQVAELKIAPDINEVVILPSKIALSQSAKQLKYTTLDRSYMGWYKQIT